ncbi:glycogen synthase GlgA [Planococcus sp. N028]|uniref:Glycogen synthase n=1 Tax=Planococcus shixiaomingii TaxID=3058393 RepID=A0ABT8N605_9BACL|nr:glycogen synthase GlgA [Planococcus sp. N028]MDN7243173.1 glycogen synthase GlgA [Planococcus sp. N028]
MKIVMAATESAPFVKVGGLGDVMGALPKELVELGHEVMVLLPKYNLIPEKYEEEFSFNREIEFLFKYDKKKCGIYDYELNGVRYVFLEHDAYFKRDRVYGHTDDAERYAFFNRAALLVMQELNFKADILHVHDWHAAMLPFLVREDEQYKKFNEQIKTMLTIHNLFYQGPYSREVFLSNYEMDERYFDEGMVEWNGKFNMMKTGLLYADLITTVSPSYRDEILTEKYGENLHPLLQERQADFIGIVNGIDTAAYNPASDLMIEKEYDHTSMEEKAANKRALQKKFELPVRGDIPLLTMVSRLSRQKGIDVLMETLPEILGKSDVQFLLLGTGEEKNEQFFRKLAEDYPKKVGIYIGFDEALAHLMYAGADIFLMPSHFEPCGLSQMVSMRYGTIPVANKTGGLKDTIEEYNENNRTGTGFLSDFSQGEPFSEALQRALSLYSKPEHWETIKHNGMTSDFSWAHSAKEYAKEYERIVRG